MKPQLIYQLRMSCSHWIIVLIFLSENLLALLIYAVHAHSKIKFGRFYQVNIRNESAKVKSTSSPPFSFLPHIFSTMCL